MNDEQPPQPPVVLPPHVIEQYRRDFDRLCEEHPDSALLLVCSRPSTSLEIAKILRPGIPFYTKRNF